MSGTEVTKNDQKRLFSVAGLCKDGLCRQLYQIVSVRTVTKTRAEKRRTIHIDLAISLGIPLLQIPLRRRYNIFEDIGCLGETYPQHKSFYRSRAQFKELLSANKNLNLNRYHLGPVGDVRVVGLSPWISWAETHSNYRGVVSLETLQWATAVWHSRPSPSVWDTARFRGAQFERVCLPLLCYISSFPLLTLPSLSATSKYHLSSSHGSSRGASATLPVFIRKDTTQKRDSFDSFSDMSASYGGISPLEYDAEKARVLGGGREIILPPRRRRIRRAWVGKKAEVEVSSLHPASVHVPTPPEPAHTRPVSISFDPRVHRFLY
ncbi:hypothetical protein B0H13DRAFT_2350270 [Mycena leptocephala]|nr:hypothetical protein B0H13DRAFT_2350270 [Mycena leptocephala]